MQYLLYAAYSQNLNHFLKMNNTISPTVRLMIAARILAGMQAPNYRPTQMDVEQNTDGALAYTDELIKQSGCTVETAEDSPNDSHGH